MDTFTNWWDPLNDTVYWSSYDEGYRYATSARNARPYNKMIGDWQSEHQCWMGSLDPINRWFVQVLNQSLRPIFKRVDDKQTYLDSKSLMTPHLRHPKLQVSGGDHIRSHNIPPGNIFYPLALISIYRKNQHVKNYI